MRHTSEITYRPAWWVPGGHLQTLWGKFVRRQRPDLARRERWPTPDGDEIEIRRLDAVKSTSPRLLILHGLEGTSRSHYIPGLVSEAQARGWAADAMLFRTCNGELNRERRLYHSGGTTDVDYVVRRVVRENPGRPLVAVGVSLGGNVLLKWLGERGSALPPELRAAVAISVPYDLERGSRHIERGFSRVYTWHFLRSLRRKALMKRAMFPDLFDPAALGRVRTLYDFDHRDGPSSWS